jgi:hypothetical protein
MESEGKKELTIISTPYRVGTHTSTMPTAFIPIIDNLVALHAEGYVHGDIRAYNMVFGDSIEDGWLIDFDFAGPYGKARYPPNYQKNLDDGIRLGKHDVMITKMHDWYALFNVMFIVHRMDRQHMDSEGDFLKRYYDMDDYISKMQSSDDIPFEKQAELKKLLTDYENAKGRFCPSQNLLELLDECRTGDLVTRGEGTGSPYNGYIKKIKSSK